jgi:YbbR domain-containing protein
MRFLLRNWHLKLSAVLLATVLYTGLVFSGTFSDSRIELPVRTTGQPEGSVVLSGAAGTVSIVYRADRETATALTADSFRATVDLSEYDMERAPEAQVLNIDVESLVDGVRVTERSPQTVTVEIDRIEQKSVPVAIDYGIVPNQLEIDDATLGAETVEVRGAASLVGRVDRAVARVLIDESGIGVHRSVTLEAVDIDGQPVNGVQLDPEAVDVDIDVHQVETNKTVPVRPDIEPGTPAAGFALAGLNVEPSTVTLRGLPDVLSEIGEVLTEPLSIDGASETQSFEAELILPEDVTLTDGDEPVVTVTATIEPSVSSRTFVVGVVCTGSGSNGCVPGVDQLTVTVGGPGDALAGLGAADVTPSIDASGLAPGSYTLTPSIPALPAGVELIGISPGGVAVTIVAPATPAPTPAP